MQHNQTALDELEFRNCELTRCLTQVLEAAEDGEPLTSDMIDLIVKVLEADTDDLYEDAGG